MSLPPFLSFTEILILPYSMSENRTSSTERGTHRKRFSESSLLQKPKTKLNCVIIICDFLSLFHLSCKWKGPCHLPVVPHTVQIFVYNLGQLEEPFEERNQFPFAICWRVLAQLIFLGNRQLERSSSTRNTFDYALPYIDLRRASFFFEGDP